MNVELVNYDWEFIQKYYPNYTHCNLVLQSDIITKYFEGQSLDEEDSKWIQSLGGTDELVKIHANEIEGELYDKALQAYKEELLNNMPKEEPKVEKFSVHVVRIGYAHKEIEVEATSQEEANIKAINIASDYEFSEHDVEYKISDF